MAEKRINPVLKQVLELGPTLLFFLAYLRLKERSFEVGGTEYSGFIVATVLFVPILLVAMGILWALTGKLSRMQIFTAVVVVFFGGLTAWFNDERFFKMKTSIVYGLFAVLLGIGIAMRKSWLEWIMGEVLPMQREGWDLLTRRLALMFGGLAIANEVIWRTQSDQTWVTIETFVFPAVLFVFLWVQIAALQKYLITPEE
ncbi:inner membrane-spanning protein YciB [Pseudoroseicyclus aestuarii]|uniref:Inner membrane-spanning protein YciB n=1 Tax=Pseudoroseicyclus aestuarii TaxID=1795041 RepID=A0A318SZI2_9RHOB|nr:inner membrane-spanning protein YciB [Pseudoroseicyclus aestuarii]PYE85836.1 intracellular septation protein A [Pseudoroseicyclus aestuarii]